MRNDLRLADRHTPEHGSLSERAHEVPIDAFEDMRSTIEIHRPEGSGPHCLQAVSADYGSAFLSAHLDIYRIRDTGLSQHIMGRRDTLNGFNASDFASLVAPSLNQNKRIEF